MTEVLVSSTVLILALAALRLLLRGKIDPRLQYALWLLAARTTGWNHGWFAVRSAKRWPTMPVAPMIPILYCSMMRLQSVRISARGQSNGCKWFYDVL